MKVLIAVDLSGAAETLLATITKRDWPKDTEFYVMTVVEATTGRFAYRPFEGSPEELDTAIKIAGDRLSSFMQTIKRHLPHATINGGAVAGGAVEAIIAKAVQIDADLILVGHQGTYGQGGYSLGGVAERVVQHAPCSVIVVKPKMQMRELATAATQGAER